MINVESVFENELLEQFRMLSEEKQREVLDFVAFIRTKLSKPAEPRTHADNASIIQETWGSIPLDKATSLYIAEDKELEYDV